MNTCQNCGVENTDNGIYCHDCGSQLLFYCNACGQVHVPRLKFCPNNGKNIADADARVNAAQEEKQKKEQLINEQKAVEAAYQQKYGRKEKLSFIAIMLISFIISYILLIGNLPYFANSAFEQYLVVLFFASLPLALICVIAEDATAKYFRRKFRLENS